MIVGAFILALWAFLALRSVRADYRYYKAVQTLEPAIWAQLGSPRFLRIPVAFVSSKGVVLLKPDSQSKNRAFLLRLSQVIKRAQLHPSLNIRYKVPHLFLFDRHCFYLVLIKHHQ